MASLPLVVETAGKGVADLIEALEVGALAEPAADEDFLEGVASTHCQNLGHASIVELVMHHSLTVVHSLLGVVLELEVLG